MHKNLSEARERHERALHREQERKDKELNRQNLLQMEEAKAQIEEEKLSPMK